MEVDTATAAAPSRLATLLKAALPIDPLLETKRPIAAQLALEKERRPDKTNELTRLEELLDKQLYHQLTDAVFDYVSHPHFSAPPTERQLDGVEFASGFLWHVRQKLSALRLVAALLRLCEPAEPLVALKLLAIFDDALSEGVESRIMFETVKAGHLIRLEEYSACEDLLDSTEETLKSRLSVDIAVHATYHKIRAASYKGQKCHAAFLTHSLAMLAFTPLETLTESERPAIAYDLCVAILTADDRFNFGELLQHGVLSGFADTSSGWIVDFVRSFNDGQLGMFDAALAKHRVAFLASELGDKEDVLRSKLTQLALMELAFQKPKQMRQLTFDEVATHCRVPADDVERLVMTSMCRKLLEGRVDGVEKIIRVTWVKPRILDSQKLALMQKRLGGWSQMARETLVHLEELTPELLVS